MNRFTKFGSEHHGRVFCELNCFCVMDHYQRSTSSQISYTPQAGFEPAQNLSSGFVE